MKSFNLHRCCCCPPRLISCSTSTTGSTLWSRRQKFLIHKINFSVSLSLSIDITQSSIINITTIVRCLLFRCYILTNNATYLLAVVVVVGFRLCRKTLFLKKLLQQSRFAFDNKQRVVQKVFANFFEFFTPAA